MERRNFHLYGLSVNIIPFLQDKQALSLSLSLSLLGLISLYMGGRRGNQSLNLLWSTELVICIGPSVKIRPVHQVVGFNYVEFKEFISVCCCGKSVGTTTVWWCTSSASSEVHDLLGYSYKSTNSDTDVFIVCGQTLVQTPAHPHTYTEHEY